jgi:hypothetical protein
MSQRVYNKLTLAYSGTKQYTSTSFLKDNVIGDPDYVLPLQNHPTCIDSESVYNNIKLSNFTTSLQNCVIAKFLVYDFDSDLLVFQVSADLYSGQEQVYQVLQGKYRMRVALRKANALPGSDPLLHGDIELKNTTDNIVLIANADTIVVDELYEFTPVETIINKEYQITVKT